MKNFLISFSIAATLLLFCLTKTTTTAFQATRLIPSHFQQMLSEKDGIDRLLEESPIQLFAKKKKGKKKSKKQKKGGFEWASTFTLQPFEAQGVRELASTAVASFKGLSGGDDLCPELLKSSDIPKTLWNAPIACAIVAPSEQDDIIKYANVAALETINLKPVEFEKLFSTGPPPKQKVIDSEAGVVEIDKENTNTIGDDKIKLNLPSVMKGDKKLERNYEKKIMKRGESGQTDDITIVDAFRWDLQKSNFVDGKFVTESLGVAYAWSEWMVGESLLCSLGGQQKEIEDLSDLEERIQQQGDFIRDLKEKQGLTNKDPKVVDAVAELLRLKALQ